MSRHPARHIRRIAAIAPVLIAALACAGGKDKSDPTSPGNTQGTVNGGWSGTTSQGRFLEFLVADGNVVMLMVSTNVTVGTCVSGFTYFMSSIARQTTYPVANGQFSATTASTSGSRTVAGTLNTAGTGSGTLVVNDSKCATTYNGTWTANKATTPAVNLTGTWAANFSSSAQPTPVQGSFVLTQNGSTITGTYSTATGGAGTVSGSVFGRMFLFAMTQTTPGCTGSFTGHGAVHPTPEFLAYNYTGSDCLGAHNLGGGSASR